MAVNKSRPINESGYLSSRNSTETEIVKFSFDDQRNVAEKTFHGSSSSFIKDNSVVCENNNGESSMKLNLEGGTIYRRRQRSFSDPSPCSTNSSVFINNRPRCSFIRNEFSSRHQSVQTCTYCSFHNGTLPCSICFYDGSHGSSNVMLRQIAIIAPFKEANLLNATIASTNIRPWNIVIDDIAHRLRSISDDIDQQYGALPAHANANVGFFGLVWGFLQVMVAAFARLVDR